MSEPSSSANTVTGIIIVDHGSRRAASNDMLEVAAKNFAAQSTYDIVEPAHMELADPDIATAFGNCVQRGATRVIVFPYFLSPGRHWSEDIPRLVAEAAGDYPNVEWLVTAPFGLHSGISGIINDRIAHCLNVAKDGEGSCDACSAENPCQFGHRSRTAVE